MRSLRFSMIVFAVAAVACGSDTTTDSTPTTAPTTTTAVASDTTGAADSAATTTAITPATSGSSTFVADVWADNWFSLTINGALVGEDSVPITTERSFNSETITFQASYPLTVAVVAKDFKEDDTGLEYIGTDRQQMGDGGIILQITDSATGQVVVVTDATWRVLTVHRAPLNTECERDTTPTATCQTETTPEPSGWEQVDFDDSSWSAASVFSEADVSPKDGYDQIDWNASAQLIWGDDLEIDNTILMRLTIAG